jgi:hypothetical protein
VFFGATVTVADRARHERTVSIVGIDEIDTARGTSSPDPRARPSGQKSIRPTRRPSAPGALPAEPRGRRHPGR